MIASVLCTVAHAPDGVMPRNVSKAHTCMVWGRFGGPALQDLTPLLAAGGLGLHRAMGLPAASCWPTGQSRGRRLGLGLTRAARARARRCGTGARWGAAPSRRACWLGTPRASRTWTRAVRAPAARGAPPRRAPPRARRRARYVTALPAVQCVSSCRMKPLADVQLVRALTMGVPNSLWGPWSFACRAQNGRCRSCTARQRAGLCTPLCAEVAGSPRCRRASSIAQRARAQATGGTC